MSDNILFNSEMVEANRFCLKHASPIQCGIHSNPDGIVCGDCWDYSNIHLPSKATLYCYIFVNSLVSKRQNSPRELYYNLTIDESRIDAMVMMI